MAQHSGRFGMVNGASTVQDWSVEDSQQLFEVVASNTAGATGQTGSVEDWQGNFTCFGYTPFAMPGDQFSFIGYTAPDNDASGVGWTYSGQALISQLVANWNFTAGEVLSLAYDFQGHLALTPNAAAAQISDGTVASAPLVQATKIQYSTDNGSTWTNWTAVSTVAFTVTNGLQTYVDSDTIVNSRIWTGRKKGISKATIAITEHNNDRTRFIKGQQLMLRLYVTSTLFWEIKWAKVENFSGLKVDMKSGAILQQTVNLKFSIIDDGVISSTPGVLGHIAKPDTTIWVGT